MLRVLTFSSLYPSTANPQHGVFIENRNHHLNQSGQVDIRVVAPVPWFPFRSESFGKYAEFARTPRDDVRLGIPVSYPRFPTIPGIGMSIAPVLMAKGSRRTVERIAAGPGGFDVIDSYYLYPDGVAAAIIAKKLDKPLVMTALGSDANLLPEHPLPRKQILKAASEAAAISTVSAALKERLVELGVEAAKINVILHGVDRSLFRASDTRATIRRKLGIRRRTLLCVGNLLESKGQHLVVEALRELTETDLIIIGTGEREAALRDQIEKLGLTERVSLLGRLKQGDLPDYYAAADALVLPSSREGIPNVLLESMACGTPVIATSVGGIPEVVTTPAAGVLLKDRSVESIVRAVNELSAEYPSRSETIAVAETFSWQNTTELHLKMLNGALLRT